MFDADDDVPASVHQCASHTRVGRVREHQQGLAIRLGLESGLVGGKSLIECGQRVVTEIQGPHGEVLEALPARTRPSWKGQGEDAALAPRTS